jgi:GR25 family glycosyltransferase involved in LPS biosynthesis
VKICLYLYILDKQQQRKCAVTMEHVDVWYEMAERKLRLALILEDDAIFVPFFKEKFTRMIYAAIHKGVLRINGTCVKSEKEPISSDEWIHQNPMIVIGTCFNFHGQSFQKDLSNAPPVLTTHKSNPSRCTHAYLLTSCSAQALIDQIHAQQNDFWQSDFMQNHLFSLSPTLQSFWMDPPLVYQGNQVIDLDRLSSFTLQTYMSLD